MKISTQIKREAPHTHELKYRILLLKGVNAEDIPLKTVMKNKTERRNLKDFSRKNQLNQKQVRKVD